jgi:hypothetical protein
VWKATAAMRALALVEGAEHAHPRTRVNRDMGGVAM